MTANVLNVLCMAIALSVLSAPERNAKPDVMMMGAALLARYVPMGSALLVAAQTISVLLARCVEALCRTHAVPRQVAALVQRTATRCRMGAAERFNVETVHRPTPAMVVASRTYAAAPLIAPASAAVRTVVVGRVLTTAWPRRPAVGEVHRMFVAVLPIAPASVAALIVAVEPARTTA